MTQPVPPANLTTSTSGRLPVVAVTAALAGLIAAWLAAGSCGLFGHYLRHALTWLALAIAIVTAWPASPLPRRGWLSLLITLAAAFALSAPLDATINLWAIPVVLCFTFSHQAGPSRAALRAAALATAVFALYRLLLNSVPAVWHVADALSHLLAGLVGRALDLPLRVGATFGGLDFVVLALAWSAAAVAATPPPRRLRATGAVVAILLAHVAYLAVLAHAGNWVAQLPKAPTSPDVVEGLWPAVWRHAIPWKLPLAALLLQTVIAAAIARWAPWQAAPASSSPAPAPAKRTPAWCVALLLATAVALGMNTSMAGGRASLAGKKIVFYEEGFLNWLKPEHNGEYGRLSIGMYGLLPHFLRSLGATPLVSKDLSAADLAGAEVLVLIFPDKPWQPAQLERIWDFVRRGGSLWVLGEHTVEEAAGGSRFNDVLGPTGIRVKFDSAEFAVGGWLDSYDIFAHPATIGVPDTRNQFGLVIGASLDTRWPAHPVLAGRWGWSDWGDRSKSSMMGNGRYNAGEQLGDVVLAAEQKLGRGRVVVFGDTSTLSNGINMGSYGFTARLLAALANHTGGPLDGPRATLTLLLACAMLVLLARVRCARSLALALLLLGLARMAGAWITGRTLENIPQSGRDPDYGLAYVDHAHLGRFSGESWRDDGLMGIELTFMRNGYLTLSLPDVTRERLDHADLLLSVAPASPYTRAERAAIRAFIERGGIFILTVGRDDRHPAQSLLDEFGFDIGDGTEPAGSARGPIAMGFFKAPYFNAGDYMAYVRFHAAWPVTSTDSSARILAYGKGNLATILMRNIGRGKMIVVGDSAFAMNKNLEVEGGQPFEGMRENPDFWRWLFTDLRDQPHWVPPNPADTHAAAGQESTP
ncbi:MAG: hypothetical protein K8T26_02540 [Lentisphaerae bacterium]|nr:hypothetical protein [Lentisphaerota bacterium]